MASQKFYSLEQAAERLGVEPQAVKDMAAQGRLQQFRDRDQLMFKSDEVEALASSDATQLDQPGPSGDTAVDQPSPAASNSGTDASGPIPLAENDATSGGSQPGVSPADSSAGTAAGSSGFSDAIGLSDADSKEPQQPDNRDATGISVFDADEVEHADPTAQTQVNQSGVGDEEAALDQVGSGSGLLDLTRESDDTSLGAAELLDEIYPGGGNESADADTASESGSAIGSSGLMDATQGSSQQGASGVEGSFATQMAMDQPAEGSAAAGAAGFAGAYVQAEPYDPGGSGFGAGMLTGAAITLILGLLVAVGELLGVQSPVLNLLTGGPDAENPGQMVLIWSIGLLVGSAVLGLLGGVIAKAAAGR